MALYPRIQGKAQASLHAYMKSMSSGRQFPNLSDRPNLPYIEALMYDILRWNPSVPFGLPHVATQDSVYRRHEIQLSGRISGKRAFCVSVSQRTDWRVRSILHDEQVHPSPLEFKPERYLDREGNIAKESKQTITVRTAFGFGRRICTGLYLAENSLFLAISMLLHAFNVSGHEDGPPSVAYSGFIRYVI